MLYSIQYFRHQVGKTAKTPMKLFKYSSFIPVSHVLTINCHFSPLSIYFPAMIVLHSSCYFPNIDENACNREVLKFH